jgi:hypothetical protein
MVITPIIYILVVSLCAASISYTISMAGIFKWLRTWIERIFPEKIVELVHCPYCLAHYIILCIMLTTTNVSNYLIPVSCFVVYNFLFTWFVIVCLVSLLHFVMLRAYAPVAILETHRLLKKSKSTPKH